MNSPLLIDPSEAFLTNREQRGSLEGRKVCITLLEDPADRSCNYSFTFGRIASPEAHWNYFYTTVSFLYFLLSLISRLKPTTRYHPPSTLLHI